MNWDTIKFNKAGREEAREEQIKVADAEYAHEKREEKLGEALLERIVEEFSEQSFTLNELNEAFGDNEDSGELYTEDDLAELVEVGYVEFVEGEKDEAAYMITEAGMVRAGGVPSFEEGN